MNYVFHPDAEVELNQAIEWYETREPSLGLRRGLARSDLA
jgi:hypothetical protein